MFYLFVSLQSKRYSVDAVVKESRLIYSLQESKETKFASARNSCSINFALSSKTFHQDYLTTFWEEIGLYHSSSLKALQLENPYEIISVQSIVSCTHIKSRWYQLFYSSSLFQHSPYAL
jgi:hypothetical protein